MFETHKIDIFFSGEKNLLDEEEKIFMTRRMKVVRFLKLFLPCLTAMLLGLGVVLFDFETSNDSTFGIAEDEKVYFEKFRMKNTTFEITKKDDQLSTLKADIVEEITPGSKKYKLVNPDAVTLDKDKVITLISQNGLFDQSSYILDLDTNVVADYNKQMKIKTNSATYNFKTDKGFGNEKIVGDGEKGNFSADKFDFDKKKGVINLRENVVLHSQDSTLKTPKVASLFMNENKFTAKNAVVTKGNDTLKGDNLTVFFKDTKSFEVIKAISEGHSSINSEGKTAHADKSVYYANSDLIKLYDHVKIVNKEGYVATSDLGTYDYKKKHFILEKNVVITDTRGYKATADYGIYDITKKTLTLSNNVNIRKGNNTITAPKAVYFATKEEFRFYDNVIVIQNDCTARAQSGIYYVKKNIAELEHNVVIEKDGNIVYGDKAISDLKTSQSRLIAKKGGRISGKLIENKLKRKKDE